MTGDTLVWLASVWLAWHAPDTGGCKERGKPGPSDQPDGVDLGGDVLGGDVLGGDVLGGDVLGGDVVDRDTARPSGCITVH